MSQIGSFTRNNDGTYTGTIKTLAIDAKVRLVPSDPTSTSDKAPDLRVLVSGVEACHAGTVHDGVRLLGGTVEVDESPAGGALITVRIPCA